jgi:hypothetical protein
MDFVDKVDYCGHKLILRVHSIFERIYYCKECKIKVMEYTTQQGKYFYNFEELNLTCEEIIIKSIIE